MVFAGDHVEPEAYNRLLYEQQRLLPMRVAGVSTLAAGQRLTLDRQSAEARPFVKFRVDEGYASIDNVEVRKLLQLEEQRRVEDPLEEVRVLLRYNNGQPAIVSKRRAGEGDVMLITTSASDERWTDWFIAPSFVPFAQVALNTLLEGQPLTYNRTAGDSLRYAPPKQAADRLWEVLLPDNTRVRLGYPESVQGRAVVTATETARAGVYRIVPVGASPSEEQQSASYAVIPDPNESED